MPAVASSPCIRLCTLDDATGLCLGCGRTLAEIAAWAGMSEAQRQARMILLPARLARLGTAADPPSIGLPR